MGTIYLAKYSVGSYDDFTERIVFATTDKKKVTKWVTKFNRIRKAYLEMYKPYTDKRYGFDWIMEKYSEEYFDRWYKISNVNKAFWEEVEIR